MKETFKEYRWSSIVAAILVAFIYLILGLIVPSDVEPVKKLFNELGIPFNYVYYFILYFLLFYIIIFIGRIIWAVHNLLEYGFYYLNKLKEKE